MACKNCAGNHFIAMCGEPCVACTAAIAAGTVLKHVGGHCPVYSRYSSAKKANKAGKKKVQLSDMDFSDEDDSD